MANTSTRGILLTMLSAVTFGFAFTLGPMTYGEAGSNPVTLTFLRNFLSLPVLLAILWYQGISLQVSAKELWSLTILGGIGNAVTTLMLFIAFSLIDVGVATTGCGYERWFQRRDFSGAVFSGRFRRYVCFLYHLYG